MKAVQYEGPRKVSVSDFMLKGGSSRLPPSFRIRPASMRFETDAFDINLPDQS